MKTSPLRLLVAGIICGSALLTWSPIARASKSGQDHAVNYFSDANLEKDLRDCIDEKRRLSIVFLVDESKSLVANPKSGKLRIPQ